MQTTQSDKTENQIQRKKKVNSILSIKLIGKNLFVLKVNNQSVFKAL